VPSGTRPPPGGLEVGSAWRYVSPAKRSCCCSCELLGFRCTTYKAFGDPHKVGLLGSLS